MATWVLKITVKDVVEKRISAVATRTDGEDVRIYHILDAIIDTLEQKNAAIDQFWEMYQEDITRQSIIDTMVGTLEIAGANALNAKEI